ncbi:hypothetical protein NQ318_022579, partial [Aromia moschata]
CKHFVFIEKIDIFKQLSKFHLQFLFVDVSNALEKLKTVLHRDYYRLGVVLDGDCENFTGFVNEYVDKKYFYETYHWLIASSSEETVLAALEKVKLNVNSDVHLVVPLENGTYTIVDVYNPAFEHGGKLIKKEIGYYNRNDGYIVKIRGNKYWERRNMTGATFKSAVVIPHLDKPLKEYLSNDGNRRINSMHRFQTACVNHCKDFFNFRSTFIYRRPKPKPKSYEIFLKPLETQVWISISVIMVVITITLKIIFRNELSVRPKRNGSIDSSWSFLFLFTLGAFCQQGATCYPKLFSSRIASVFVFLFCILIYQFYSASIVSYLLMDPPRTINNLRDLVDSDLRVGIEDILIDRNYFVQTTDPDAISLYRTKIEEPFNNNSGFYLPNVGLELVKNGGFAFHVETSTAYPIIEETFSNELICELEEIKMYKIQPMHTNLQKTSPFKDMLNYCMLKLAENGNIHRLRKYWDARQPTCIEAAKKIEIHVNIHEFSCGLIVLSYGICCSLIFLAMEIVYVKRNAIILKLKILEKPTIYPFVDSKVSAWNEDGKGENVWDYLLHNYPELSTDGSNGDVACDSYHKYKEDVALLKYLGVDHYRFSISWSRILPEGFSYKINDAGVQYYKNLIKELKDNGIEPLVTIFHWDTPQPIHEAGGWTSEFVVDYFADYARVCFKLFGDDVKYWITFNEPKQICQQGYGAGVKAPAVKSPGIGEYLCAHNVIKSHAKAWRIYDEEFRSTQNGIVGITIDTPWFEPNTTSDEDVMAAERQLQFEFGWYANPIFNGDYPEIMKIRVAMRSKLEGFTTSRLPAFTEEEIVYINGTYDFLGLNHYSSYYTTTVPEPEIGDPSWEKDTAVEDFQDPSWSGSASEWVKFTPWGLRKLLKWIKDTYHDPPIIITENGISDNGTLGADMDDESLRTHYVKYYLSNIRDAMEKDVVNVFGYTVWSLLDNLEWTKGFTEKFGLYQVDFNNPNRTRTAKKSATFYKNVINTRCLLDSCEE